MSITAPTVTVEVDFTSNLSAGLAYYEQVSASGPYAYHRLQETAGTSAADASGNGVTGTYTGTYTLNQTTSKPVTGETASRYVLFGGDGVTPGRVNFTGVQPAGDVVTIEAWVRQDTLAAGDFYPIFDNNGTTADKSMLALEVQGDGRLMFYTGAGWTVTTTAQITAGVFAHVAAVFDGQNQAVRIYVNGVSVSVGLANFLTAGTGSVTDVDLSWRWGYDQAAATASSVDRIGDPAIYLRALDATEISDHYNAASTVPFSDYTWTNVTSYLINERGVNRSFGRDDNLEDVSPMELSFELRNNDRRFEPEYTSSPYYPNVVPGRPCRVRMVQDAVTYDWAFGYIQDFPQVYEEGSLFGTVPIVAHCFLERMNQDTLGERPFLSQLAGGRMTALLNTAGQPLARRTLDAGANTLMTQTVTGGSSGDHARQAARSDRGLVFFNGAGYAIFQDGNRRTTNTRSTVSQATLGPSSLQYRRPQFHAPAGLIRNEINLRRPGGVEQVSVDSVSQKKYGRRSYGDELLLATDAALATRAAALLADYKDPSLRVKSVEFNPAQGAGFWAHSLGVQLSDRYTWVFDPMQGATLTRDVFVEGVTDTYTFGEYSSTWFLSLV